MSWLKTAIYLWWYYAAKWGDCKEIAKSWSSR